MAVKVIVAHTHAHATQGFTTTPESDSAKQSLLAKGAVMVVHQQKAWGSVAGNKDILPAVFVGIKGNYRETIRPPQSGNSRFLGNVSEGSISVIPIERMRGKAQATGTAIRRHTFEVAIGYLERRLGGSRQIDLDIVGNE